jgi:hypothetical protein
MWTGTGYMLSDGTSTWTPSRGKVCPGAERIHQLKTIVLPAIFSGTAPQEDDLFEDTDRTKLDAIHRQITTAIAAGQSSFAGTIEATLGGVQMLVNEGRSHTSALAAAIAMARVDEDQDLALVLAALARIQVQLTPEQVERLAGQLAIDPQAIQQAADLELPEAA